MTKLTGEALAKKVKTLLGKGFGLSACCIECGYYSTGPEDKKIPAASLFQRALLAAAGFDFGATSRGATSDLVRVMKTHTVVLAPSRVKSAGLEPGNQLKITHNPTDGSFVLTKIDE